MGCKICGRKVRKLTLGMCGRHYWRLKKYGDPLYPVRQRAVDDEPKKVPDRGLQRAALYGLTVDEIGEIWEAQGGLCGICDEPLQKTGTKSFNIDHCHQTGLVRGLLCRGCNYALGMMRDSIDRLNAALAYLSREERWGAGEITLPPKRSAAPSGIGGKQAPKTRRQKSA